MNNEIIDLANDIQLIINFCLSPDKPQPLLGGNAEYITKVFSNLFDAIFEYKQELAVVEYPLSFADFVMSQRLETEPVSHQGFDFGGEVILKWDPEPHMEEMCTKGLDAYSYGSIYNYVELTVNNYYPSVPRGSRLKWWSPTACQLKESVL